MKYYLAIDIGASSGRHILGWVDNGKLYIEEIYRFENKLIKEEQGLLWDIDNLVKQVKLGMKKCSKFGKIPVSVAVDTWGVDYVLTDKDNNILYPVFSYRNSRTDNTYKEIEEFISQKELYELTGIQKQSFNTVYQLYEDKKSGKLDKAENFMMIPAYLSYCLCGKIYNEYTDATTTGLCNALNYEFDKKIINKLSLKKALFNTLLMPGEYLGNLTKEIKEYVGYDCKVVFCPSHDTASAVAACPIDENDIFISSGTWSLIGCEILNPILTEEARKCNFTNEGGIEHRFRFLKNYTGMWMLQNIRHALDGKYSYDEMMEEAKKSSKYFYIDVNAPELTAPDNMIEAIKKKLNMPDLTLGEVINSVYHSLAKSYKDAVLEIEAVTGKCFNSIRIVGGGSKDSYLNRLTEEYTGKKVIAGPSEATAIGNVLSQILADNKELTLKDVRDIIGGYNE